MATMADSVDTNVPVVVASCDSHVGPLLNEQLRPYCPKKYLDAFDDFARGYAESGMGEMFRIHPNIPIPGHHDAAARLHDMDRDGIATEVLYHFSMNGEPFPFMMQAAGGLTNDASDLELATIGYHLYNEWLADWVSVDSQRLLGLAYLPTWDIDLAVKEVEWAAAHGLHGVNFPPPGRPDTLLYNHPEWDPFWAACVDHNMPLNTHSSGGQLIDYSGPGGINIQVYEGGGWLSRRAVWWLIHGFVFERFPDLRLVITEQYEGWYLPTMRELDAIYMRFGTAAPGPRLPRQPSEYIAQNVFLGASFMSTWQAEDAVRNGYATNVFWGRDYPHVEGVFQQLDDPEAETVTSIALRHLFSHVPPRETLMMAGENLMQAFGLDAPYLRKVAADIGAPTVAQLHDAPDPSTFPPIGENSNAFRGQAGPRLEVIA
jgi:predicted TIM-barrel fold metal-dependent hydrolase